MMDRKTRSGGRRSLLCGAVVAVCFLYAGSAYMSQFARLTAFYDERTVDLITSCWNYLLQAAGISLYMLGLRFRPSLFRDMRLFAALLAAGLPAMAVMQTGNTGAAVQWAGYLFHLLVGLYFGFYLTLLAERVPGRYAALTFGAAYAAGSLGTYLLSLVSGGSFLTSPWITFLYLALAAAAAALALTAGSPRIPAETPAGGKCSAVTLPAALVAVMTAVSVLGSGLYYSLPQAAGVDWNLIRAFYALGLVAAGFVTDRSRSAGEILAAGSLVYPLVAFAIMGEGVSGTATLAVSYLFRGPLTVFTVIVFADLASQGHGRLWLAPAGLLAGRVTEASLTFLLMTFRIPVLAQILVAAGLTGLVIVLLVLRQRAGRVSSSGPMSESARDALFAEVHGLTGREEEILRLISDGLSDDEISARLHVSRSTVRFHVSNLLKKTNAASRVEAARALQKFR